MGDFMKKILILIALLFSACSSMNVKPLLTSNDVYRADLELNDQGIPIECYDENGVFDSNRGHDYLDCDNLQNRIQFK